MNFRSGRIGVRSEIDLMSSESRPRISVVIPCKDYGRYLVECVGSVLAQDHPDFEILIVDDGSQDATARLARDLVQSAGLDGAGRPRVRVLTLEGTGQPALARNAGIGASSSPFILCLDADDRIGPGFLEAAASVLESDPMVALAYPDQLDFGEVVGEVPHPEYDARALIHYNFIPPASLFRRGLWVAIGGFRANVIGYEDWDFWVAALAQGGRGRRVPGVHWHYRRKAGGLYERQVSQDAYLKACVVSNNSSLYAPSQLKWAARVLAGDQAAIDLGAARGVVPNFDHDPAGAPPSARSWDESSALAAPVASPSVELPRILFTMYGWKDEGGGTILPRQIIRELARRGHEVAVLYASVRPSTAHGPFAVEEGVEDGVRLYALHNRLAAFTDPARPELEVDEPQARRRVAEVLRDFRPDIVHVHSLPGFSMGLLDEIAAYGVPAVYTSHNYWPICPRMYLFQADLNLCAGPADDGANCAVCVGRPEDAPAFENRLATGRSHWATKVHTHLAVSQRVRDRFIE
ncbi:MAG: glycosyltransferase, partial [Planctomycetes bacterium]|nr:glycosyltransferase [Planctomycetota bacterium]